jgi:hypothetical protein
MSNTASFDKAKFNAAWKRFDGKQFNKDSQVASFSLLVECLSVTVQDGQVCLNLPLELGEECIDVPDWIPDGEAARACLEIRYRKIIFGKVPVGVDACIYALDQKVACAYFGI